MHGWALSLQYTHSDIGLRPASDHSDIGLKGGQSDIISDIGLTFLAISNIRYLSPDGSRYSYGTIIPEYQISD
jgi:hypothetical protein